MVDEAFAVVRVPGRLEVLGRHPLLLVDGAHNAAGMAALGRALSEEFDVEGTSVAVVGMLSGRDPSAMLAPLVTAGISTVVACAPLSPRAMAPGEVADAARALGLGVVVEPDVHDALAVRAGWSAPTAWSSWPVRSTWWERHGRTCRRPAVPWEEAGR